MVTNSIGRYVVSSLKPGAYTVTTSYAGSAYVPKSQIVAVAQKTVATADLALDAGRAVLFSAADVVFPGGNGSVDAELRNADGRVVKVFQGNPAQFTNGFVTFTGLPIGSYSLYVRRSAVPSDGPEQTEFPWVSQFVDLVSSPSQIYSLLLNQPTMNLTGTLPNGGQVKLTAVPEDTWLRPSHIDGDQVTPLALNWTEQSEGGVYTVRGIVPGVYAAAVTTARKERGDKPTTTGANLATTHSTVIVNGPAPTAAFTAPKGGTVRGVMRYDNNNRPAIAPFGFRVLDKGDQSWLFPTVSRQAEVRQAVPRRAAARRQGRGPASRPRGAVRRASRRADPRQPGQLGPQRGRHAVLVHRAQARHQRSPRAAPSTSA